MVPEQRVCRVRLVVCTGYRVVLGDTTGPSLQNPSEMLVSCMQSPQSFSNSSPVPSFSNDRAASATSSVRNLRELMHTWQYLAEDCVRMPLICCNSCLLLGLHGSPLIAHWSLALPTLAK